MSEEAQTTASSSAVQRARADLAAGREWKAREGLLAHLAGDYDAEALELLGEVNFAMRDLPAAGAAWFGTGRRGQDVDDAVDAWRERHHDQFADMFRSLPRVVREREGNPRVDALRRRAEQVDASDAVPRQGSPLDTSGGSGGPDAALVIAVGLGVAFVVCAVIGLVTVLRWLVPG